MNIKKVFLLNFIKFNSVESSLLCKYIVNQSSLWKPKENMLIPCDFLEHKKIFFFLHLRNHLRAYFVLVSGVMVNLL